MKHSILAIFCIFFACLNIANSAENTPPKKRPASRVAYRAELESLITTNAIDCKVSTDCDAVPLGAKPCGGPTEYVLLSKATHQKIHDAVSDLTKTITEMDTTANQVNGLMGTCQAVIMPETLCRSGKCVAK